MIVSLRRVVAVLSLVVGALMTMQSSPATAATLTTEYPQVRVVQLGGFVDPTSAAYLRRQIEAATQSNALAIVIQINAGGATITQDQMDQLTALMRESPKPVAMWLGPTNASVFGDAVKLLDGADVVGMADGARLGRPLQDMTVRGQMIAKSEVLSLQQARSREIVDISAPTLVEFIRQLNNQTFKGVTLQVSQDGQDLFVPVFTKPTLVERLFHVVTSPLAALFFFTTGMLLILFEFFAAAAGVVGVCGAACLALAGYGVAELGARPAAFVVYAVAILLMSSDLQNGPVRARAIVGMILFGSAGALLFSTFQPSVLAQLLVWVPQAAFVLLGIPVMIRTRFSTSVLPRESLIGANGTCTTKFADVGIVRIDDLDWLARVKPKDAPISRDAAIEVMSVDEHHLVVARAPSATISV